MSDPTQPRRPRPSLVLAVLPVVFCIASYLVAVPPPLPPEARVWEFTFLCVTLALFPIAIGALILRRPRTWPPTVLIPVVLVSGLYLFWRSETGLRTIQNFLTELGSNPDHWRPIQAP
jgi:hypothetical protein